MTLHPTNRSSERGAMLVHVAIMLIAVMAVSAFAIDFGVFWVSRRAAQNSADAAAMAGAVAMAYDDATDLSDTGPAKRSAYAMSQENQVWGEAPNVEISTDITFPVCPDGSNTCIRVDVFRNPDRGNALPMWFGQLAGIDEQGVRATATAQARVANATACLKPWIIPDKWQEIYPTPGPWSPTTSVYQTHTGNGNNRTPLANPDQYRPPTDANMTGFRASGTPNDIGMEITLYAGPPPEQQPGGAVQPGWVYPVRLNEDEPGGNVYMNNIQHCSGDVIRIGDMLRNETGVMIGPTFHGVDPLIAADASASWYDPDGVGGVPGRVVNSCQDTASCDTEYSPSETQSPRVVQIPVFDVSAHSQTPGSEWMRVVNILGFFINSRQGNTITGFLTTFNGMAAGGGDDIQDNAAFSHTVVLVR